jgi:hypothetical protein
MAYQQHQPGHSDLPEVVPNYQNYHSGPEVVPWNDELHPAEGNPHSPGVHEYFIKKEEPAAHGYPVDPAQEKKTTLFGWSRRKLWIVIGIVVLAVIAIVVGAVVGTLVGGKDSSSDKTGDSSGSNGSNGSSNTASSSTSAGSDTATATGVFGSPTSFPSTLEAKDSECFGKLCPSVLSVVRDREDTKSAFVFARGNDGAFHYRSVDGKSWDGDWESVGGSFEGTPSTSNSIPGRIDLFGIWNEERTLMTKSFRSGVWDSDWKNLTGPCLSTPSVCSVTEGSQHLFTINTSQRVVFKNYTSGMWGGWTKNNTGFLASAPVAVCEDGAVDLVAYGMESRPYQLLIRRGDPQILSALDWTLAGGDFKGDPVVLRGPGGQTNFFGIGSDDAMHYTSWKDSDELSDNMDIESLGGEFQSLPSPVIIGDSRMDVVAVGKDGHLKHKARKNGKWADDWEDLGGFFNSMPALVEIEDSKVAAFGIGPNGDVVHGLWKVGDDLKWGDGEWFTDGGDFSTSWYRVGPAK